MKKIIIILSFLLCSQTIFAQLEKGMIAVGLTSVLSVRKSVNESDPAFSNYNSNVTSKTTSYNIAPNVSYFLSNRFAIGISVGYAGYTSTSENTSNNFLANSSDFSYSKTTSNGTSISPYVKYYFPISENVHFLLKAGAANTFSTGKTSGYTDNTTYDAFGNTTIVRTNEYGPNKTNTVDITAGISPGILFMPTKKIGLEFSLGNLIAYNSRVGKTTNNTGGTSKATTSGLQLLNFNTITVGTGVYFFF